MKKLQPEDRFPQDASLAFLEVRQNTRETLPRLGPV